MHYRIKENHWIRLSGFLAVVAVVTMVSAAIGSCVDTTTNFCEKYGIRCEADQQCALNQAICIKIDGCGDGITDKNKNEVCDDGNVVDGAMITGVLVPDKCNSTCTSTQECGNGIKDIGEACDNGNHNGVSDDPCDIQCHLRDRVCGDGIIDSDLGEQCDPGANDSVGCNSYRAGPKLGCRFSQCGDGYRNPMAEKCDSDGEITENCNGPLCTTPVCGDHFQNDAFGEECDNGSPDTKGCNGDGNGDINNDGSSRCHIPFCGDGYTNTKFTPPGSNNAETCDTRMDSQTCNGDGDGDAKNNINSQCQKPACGDGYVNKAFVPPGSTRAEQCDNQGGNDTAACNGNKNSGPGSCCFPSCGDGYVNPKFPDESNGEQCDPGNGIDIPEVKCSNGHTCVACRCL